MKKSLKILIPMLAVIIVGAVFTYSHFANQFQYNNKNAIGNTTGNINNGGNFCEYDGKIYFANPNDSNKLYVMNSDCTEPKLLSNNKSSYINVCGSYIYYVKNNFSKATVEAESRDILFGLIRLDLDGSNSDDLNQTKTSMAALCGDYVYYQHHSDTSGGQMYAAKIDGTSNEKIADTVFDPACIYDGRIYYTDSANKNNIYVYDTTNGKSALVYDANAYLVDMDGSYIYYIDLSSGYSLIRLNINTKIREQIYSSKESKVINYNRYGSKIFLIVEGGSNPGLYRCNLDGANLEYIASGNMSGVYCTSQYTFFQYLDDNVSLYRVPTSGAIMNVEEITIK